MYVKIEEGRRNDTPDVIGVRICEIDIMLEDFDFECARDQLAWRLALIVASKVDDKESYIGFLRKAADGVASFVLDYIEAKIDEEELMDEADGSARAEAEKN